MKKRPTGKIENDDNYRSIGKPVQSSSSGERVDRYLAKNFPFYSRAEWQKKIREGTLIVNSLSVEPAYKIKEGDELHIYRPITEEPEVDRGIEVIWEEKGVMAVFKPSSLPMHESGPYRKNTFFSLVKEKFGDEWASVHRLDHETSGIVICGNTHYIRDNLSRQWASRDVKKEYLAIVRGSPESNYFLESGPIGDLKESAIRIKKWVVTGGLSAQTFFEVLEKKEGFSLLKAIPKTGRTNQIRIHAAYNGFPLVGDKLYNPDENVFLEYFEKKKLTDSILEKTGFHRLCLHASRLELTHPITQKRCVIECEMAPDMKAFWKAIAIDFQSSHLI
ncbi:MAG: RluA family pseudouridine synthase [Oligoflexales bacterium]|nr:RluA family pseudouridine synthase [Oligoflexales bacterium]